ncbi:MAG: hypothetical protein HY006_02435 [Candidatus Sungbacteria bacterium]|nr:hypothetical protein [Candidatus Sungbacteria bacterium]
MTKYMPRKNHLIAGALIVLALIAIVLTYLIYRQLRPASSLRSDSPQRQSEGSAPKPNVNPPQKLIADEQAALNPPLNGSTPEASKRHAELVQRLAKDTAQLDITGCTAKPVVSRVRYKTKISVKNNDAVKHLIVFDPAHTFEIPPRAIHELPIDFQSGPGIYGYGCDNIPQAVGMFLVTN